MNTKNTVMVFNTCTSQYEEVTVSEKVYNEYRRGNWRMEKNEAKYKANETPFSALIGGEDGGYENFHEFISEDDAAKVILSQDMRRAIAQLDEDEQRLIRAMFFDRMTMREYSEQFQVPLMTAQYRKARILKKMKKLLE